MFVATISWVAQKSKALTIYAALPGMNTVRGLWKGDDHALVVRPGGGGRRPRQELHLDTFDQETVHLDMLNMT